MPALCRSLPPPSSRRLSRRVRAARRGVLCAELAILLPFFLLILIGVLELGRAVMVRQELVNAAREGARRAIVPGAINAVVTGTVENYLDSTSLRDAATTVEILGSDGSAAEVAALPRHAPIRVRVTVPFQDVQWGVGGFVIGADLHADVVMRKE